MQQSDTEISKEASAAYGIFLWKLVKARPALKALADQVFAARDIDLTIAEHPDPDKWVLGILAGLARTTRNDIAKAIRNNCAGAVLQISWTLMDGHLDALGVDSASRRDVRVGHLFNGAETFSRLLWAARNAFAHGYEWSTEPTRTAARESVAVLRAVGFEKPSHEDVYEYFELLSAGSMETFIQRLNAAAREAAERHVPVERSASSSWGGILLVALFGLVLWAVRSTPKDKPTLEVVLALQLGTGEEAQSVAIATGSIGSISQIRETLERVALEELSSEAAAPYTELRARTTAWEALVEALLHTDMGSERFYRDLVEACERMDEIYDLALSLPSPIEALIRERACSSIEDLQQLLSAAVEAHSDLKAAPLRVVRIDLLNEENVSNRGSVVPDIGTFAG